MVKSEYVGTNDLPRRENPVSQEVRKEKRRTVAEAIKETGDIAKVAKRFKVSRPYIRMACMEFGVQLPKAKQSVAVMKISSFAILADLIVKKKSQSQIAKDRDISRQSVNQIYMRAVKEGLIAEKPSKSE